MIVSINFEHFLKLVPSQYLEPTIVDCCVPIFKIFCTFVFLLC